MKSFCCDEMKENIYFIGEKKVYNGDVNNKVVYYSSRFNEFGILIYDGLNGIATSYILISHCPWCGKKLPESKRDEWFDKLEELGYDEPLSQDIPQEFNSSEWYEKNI